MKKINFSTSGWWVPQCPYCSGEERKEVEKIKEDKGYIVCDDCNNMYYYERYERRVVMREVTFSTSEVDDDGNPVTHEVNE